MGQITERHWMLLKTLSEAEGQSRDIRWLNAQLSGLLKQLAMRMGVITYVDEDGALEHIQRHLFHYYETPAEPECLPF